MSGSKLNEFGFGEVITGDDSVPMRDLDVFLNRSGAWKDLGQAFRDHDVITDNYNHFFFEPITDEDRKRGYAI